MTCANECTDRMYRALLQSVLRFVFVACTWPAHFA